MANFIMAVILYIVFGAIIVIIAAPLWFPFACRLPDKGYSDFQRKMNTNILYTFMLIALLIVGITPISEYMKCSEEFVCSIHTDYQIPFTNKQRNIKINNSSYLGVIEEYHISYLDKKNRRISYVTKYYDNNQAQEAVRPSKNVDSIDYYLALYNTTETNPQIFRNVSASTQYPYIGVTTYETKMVQTAINNFEEYKKNPQQGFYTNSLLNRGRLNMRLFWCSFFAIILLLWNRKKDRKELLENIISIIRLIKTK